MPKPSTGITKTPRKRLSRIKDPATYRKNVINLAWTRVKTFLTSTTADPEKQIIVATQIALRSMDIDSKIGLQKLKGAQKVANNAFLVDALSKAQTLSNRLKGRTLDEIAVNAKNCLLAEKQGNDVPSSEYEELNNILMPRVQGKNKGEWIDNRHGQPLHRAKALDMKEKYDAVKASDGNELDEASS